MNKQNPCHNFLRIAGNFTAKHIPWYIDNEIYSVYENYITSKSATHISSISSTIQSYIESNYVIVHKQKEVFLFKKNDFNPFWINTYPFWKNDLFQLLDSYLSTDKICIDIGSWIGTTVMYAARKSKHVYAFESNQESFRHLENNCKTNCTNYTLIQNAFNKDITLQTMLNKYNINISEISFIHINSEDEEHILHDLFYIYTIYKIPLYIHFHYTLWEDKNLDRFSLLTYENKQQIIENPFTAILFH